MLSLRLVCFKVFWSHFKIGNAHKFLTVFVLKFNTTLMVSCDKEEIALTVHELLFQSKRPGYLTPFEKTV